MDSTSGEFSSVESLRDVRVQAAVVPSLAFWDLTFEPKNTEGPMDGKGLTTVHFRSSLLSYSTIAADFSIHQPHPINQCSRDALAMHCLIILTVLVQCFLINRAAVLANDFISDSHGPQVIPAPSLQVEPHVLRLTRRKGSDRLIERHQQIEEVFPYGLLNLTTVRGSIYDTEISLGNKTFVVMVDTGSPETWLAKTGFECMSINRFDEEPRPEGSCMFGATYNKTEAFEPIPGEFLYMSYGGLRTLS